MVQCHRYNSLYKHLKAQPLSPHQPSFLEGKCCEVGTCLAGFFSINCLGFCQCNCSKNCSHSLDAYVTGAWWIKGMTLTIHDVLFASFNSLDRNKIQKCKQHG